MIIDCVEMMKLKAKETLTELCWFFWDVGDIKVGWSAPADLGIKALL